MDLEGLLRQREHHVSAGSGLGKTSSAGLGALRSSAHAEGNVFTSINLVGHGYAFRNIGELILPDNFAVVLIVGANLPVGWGGNEDKTATCDQNSATWKMTSGSWWKSWNRAIRNLPDDLPCVQVIRCELRPRRTDHGSLKTRSRHEVVALSVAC